MIRVPYGGGGVTVGLKAAFEDLMGGVHAQERVELIFEGFEPRERADTGRLGYLRDLINFLQALPEALVNLVEVPGTGFHGCPGPVFGTSPYFVREAIPDTIEV